MDYDQDDQSFSDYASIAPPSPTKEEAAAVLDPSRLPGIYKILNSRYGVAVDLAGVEQRSVVGG
jgi:hypothetical protein